MNHDQKAALERVRDRMKNTPGEGFNMRIWKCGSVACAIGTAIEAGDLPGLELERIASLDLMAAFRPVYGSTEGMAAIARYFGIALEDAHWLFDGTAIALPIDEIPPSAVAEHITAWLTKHFPTTPEAPDLFNLEPPG